MGFKDLKGQRFGRLEVIENRGVNEHQIRIWNCQCDCGNKIAVTISNLTNGSTNSCGCYKKEYLSKKNKKYNRYDLSGLFGIGYTFKNEEYYFDLCDYSRIKDICWLIYNNVRSGKNNKRIDFARLILDYPSNLNVDHINGMTFDNRRENLRLCTPTQNSWNTKAIWKNNTSGYKGVNYDKESGRWFSRITCNNIEYNLGRYDNFEDAKKARIDAELNFFGEFKRKDDIGVS